MALTLWFIAAAAGYGQTPPPMPPALAPPPGLPGFVPPYEIMRSVRAAGFDPLAPPLREGRIYVLRATDFRGMLVRVVVDANTGAIRAVNRIVPAAMASGQIGMMPPPYGPPPEFDDIMPPPNGPGPSAPPPLAPHAGAARTPHPTVTIMPPLTPLPPLPRPRPAELASHKPAEDAKPEVVPSAEIKPAAKSDVTIAAPALAPTNAPPKPGRAPLGPPIND